MRADSPRLPWAGLLLAMSLLSTGCASLTPPPSRGMHLRYSPREASAPSWAEGTSQELPRALTSSPPRRQSPHGRAPSRPILAFLGAVGDVSSSTRRISGELSRLKASKRGIAGRYADLFIPFVDHGVEQLRWIDAELAATTRLSNTASEVDDPDMALALLRLGGPRLEAAMLGSILLAAWLDFLNLADVVLRQCPYYSVERLFWHMDRLQMMLAPAMTALASLEPGQVEAAATDLPSLVGHLTGEFAATRESVRVAARQFEEAMLVKELIELLTTASAMKMALPRLLPPAASATLGVGLVVGSNGVMTGTRIVVSAEWVEMMRRLVQAGVISRSRRQRRCPDSRRPGDDGRSERRTCRGACATRSATGPRCVACA